MCDTCGDNRFELIEKYKQKLLDATNIEKSPEEMAVIDNILFRFWQMGWLKGELFGNTEQLSSCGYEKDHVGDSAKMVGDSISRQAAIDTCMKYNGYGSVWACIMGDIKQLPSAQPERKKGKWEMNPDPYGFFEEIPVCSECGCTTKMREMYNYCPNCGADMRGE